MPPPRLRQVDPAALLAAHHVLSTDRASVYIGAASRDQARLIGTIVRRYAEHPAIREYLTLRHDEVRIGDRTGPTALRVIASDGRQALGWERPTLMIGGRCSLGTNASRTSSTPWPRP